jgi:hypothetical protein
MNRVCSIFSQLLQLFPRLEFEAAVKKHKANRHSRGFHCWTQFIAMLFCHLGRAQSLREICGGLSATVGKLKHLGLDGAPCKSTLAYANQHRPWELFRTVFLELLQRCQQVARAEKKHFRFKNPLVVLDSTVIQLALSMFDWAVYQREKGAAKIHLVLEHHGLLPQFAVITEGKGSDLTGARSMKFAAGTILVFDRGYQDYKWFERLTQDKVFFVTRLRCHAHIEILKQRPIVPNGTIVRDQDVRIGSQRYRMQQTMRLIESLDPETGQSIILITNHFRLAASTLAEVYEQRWQIGVSSQGHIVQSVRDRPRPKDSGLVAGEAPWRESKTAEPSDKHTRKECAQRTRLQRAVNADVASLHELPVAETVDNARKQQELSETSPKR